MDEQEIDPVKIQALEEVVYHTSHALETLMQLMVDKGFFTEDELLNKMDELSEDEDTEEIGHDADAPREPDKDE